jgi:hypothetical protein
MQVVVNLMINGEPADGRADTRADGNRLTVDAVYDQIEARLASNARRGVGPLAPALAETFGMARRPR